MECGKRGRRRRKEAAEDWARKMETIVKNSPQKAFMKDESYYRMAEEASGASRKYVTGGEMTEWQRTECKDWEKRERERERAKKKRK